VKRLVLVLRAASSLALALAAGSCGPMRQVPIEPLPPAARLDASAKVVVLPPYALTFSVSKPEYFEDKMLAEATAATGAPYPHSLRVTFFATFVERLRARTAEHGGPSITLLPAALWQEMEASPLKYVARGAQNTSYGSAFRVPSQGWLRAHGVEADYLVAPANFIGGVIVEYDQSGAMTTRTTRLSASARLMVWDVRRERMVAATTFSKGDGGAVVTTQSWREMAERAGDDIAQSRVFGGSGQPDIYLPGSGSDPGVHVPAPQ
jgi:hypothetical protein